MRAPTPVGALGARTHRWRRNFRECADDHEGRPYGALRLGARKAPGRRGACVQYHGVMNSPAEWWVTPLVVMTGYVVMFVAENVSPLRRRVEQLIPHVTRNFTTGAISLAVMTLIQAPLLVPVAEWSARNGIGVLELIELPRGVEILLAILLLDYTLWIWHWANHRVPALWRFHLVHHVDRDLDASTALRFHFGELTLSIFYRAAQIVVIGASTESVWIWQMILFVSILFHHSNWRIPEKLDRVLARLVVTPRMHGIHHDAVPTHTHSNFASLVTWWDYLHRTVRLDVPQERITIGVPAYQSGRDVTIGKILLLPFRKQRDDWRAAGSEAAR